MLMSFEYLQLFILLPTHALLPQEYAGKNQDENIFFGMRWHCQSQRYVPLKQINIRIASYLTWSSLEQIDTITYKVWEE